MSQGVRPDWLSDPSAAEYPADDPPGTVPVQPTAIGSVDWSLAALAIARSIVRAVRGASRTVTTLPPLPVITRVWWPRSMPKASMSAPVASETRSALRASSEISTCSAGEPDPAATNSTHPHEVNTALLDFLSE